MRSTKLQNVLTLWVYCLLDKFNNPIIAEMSSKKSNSSITDEENLRNYAKILLSELKRA